MNKIVKNTNKRVAKNATQHNRKTRTNTIKVPVNIINPVVDIKDNQQSKMLKSNNKKKKKDKKNKKVKTSKTNRFNLLKTNVFLKILGIICLIIAAVVFLFTTPLFNVTEIEVIGNQVVSNEEIISLSQIKLNENMFKNIKRTIKENIKGNAYIEDVSVKRVLPNKMQIEIQERTVKFMAKLLNSYAYINSQGYILEITNLLKEVPIIEGLSTSEDEMNVGTRLNNDDLKIIEKCLRIVSSFEENEISRYISSIKIEEFEEFTIIMLEKGKIIHLGNISNLDTKMLYIKAILEAEEGNEGEIFLNGDLNNGFQPYFRKKV